MTLKRSRKAKDQPADLAKSINVFNNDPRIENPFLGKPKESVARFTSLSEPSSRLILELIDDKLAVSQKSQVTTEAESKYTPAWIGISLYGVVIASVVAALVIGAVKTTSRLTAIEHAPKQAQPPAQDIHLQMEFTVRCWAVVYSDVASINNGRIYEPGQARYVTVLPVSQVTVRTGCPGKVNYLLNGKPLSIANEAKHPADVELFTLKN